MRPFPPSRGPRIPYHASPCLFLPFFPPIMWVVFLTPVGRCPQRPVRQDKTSQGWKSSPTPAEGYAVVCHPALFLPLTLAEARTTARHKHNCQ